MYMFVRQHPHVQEYDSITLYLQCKMNFDVQGLMKLEASLSCWPVSPCVQSNLLRSAAALFPMPRRFARTGPVGATELARSTRDHESVPPFGVCHHFLTWDDVFVNIY